MTGRRALRALFAPRWGPWVLAALATLGVVFLEWETGFTGGTHDQGSWWYFYWPWYEYSHTDYVVGPSNFLLTLNFLSGVALLYLPAAVVDAGIRRGIARFDASLRFTPPGRLSVLRRLGVFRLRRRLAVGLLGFAVVGSALPPHPVSVFTFPGLVAVFLLPVDGVLPELPTEYYYVVVVPVAYAVWYCLACLALAGHRYATASGAASVDAG